MKPRYHTGPFAFGNDNKSKVWWSNQADKRALFFVHGLGGSAIKSWGEFPRFLLADPDFSGLDLFFFNYESRSAQADASAQYLENSISTLMNHTAEVANKYLVGRHKRPTSFGYERITFVTHSLGAPVTRRTQILADNKGESWVKKMRIICFAPAHLGSNVPGKLDELSGVLISIIRGGAKISWPVLNDLRPNSPFMERLSGDFDSKLQSAVPDPFVALRVIFGQLEKFVPVQPPFHQDPQPEQIVNVGHSGVCKPSVRFLAPYQHLKEALK